MALLHGREDQIPVTLDVGPVSVKVRLEPCCCEDTRSQIAISFETETPTPIGMMHRSAMNFILLLWTSGSSRGWVIRFFEAMAFVHK